MEKVVYLFGAGASQAELDFQKTGVNTLFDFLSEEIYKLSKKENKDYISILNKLGVAYNQDIEHILSSFEGFSNPKKLGLEKIHKKLRNSFRIVLAKKIHKTKPRLISTLLHIHKKYSKQMGKNGEKLEGILTTNYDSLLEEGYKYVYGRVNYGFKFKSHDYKFSKNVPPIVKLHGSFNWKMKGKSLIVSKKFEISKNSLDSTCWMPPSVFKKPEQKLYNDSWEMGRKILTNCDVLRVVGSRLRNEDWSLISLIFVSQIQNSKVFPIELIIPNAYAIGDEEKRIIGITERLRFLGNLKNLSSLPIVSRGDFVGSNVFHYWLRKKLDEIEEKLVIGGDKFINSMLQEE